MYGWENFGHTFWWIFPVIMIILCFLMMRGWMGCAVGRRDACDATDQPLKDSSDSAIDILKKRFALGEIDQGEYEEKKNIINQL
jgi:uncharacterized membrane protein